MTSRVGFHVALGCIALIVAGCSPPSGPAQQAPATASTPPPATVAATPPAEPAAEPAAETMAPEEESVADVVTAPATVASEVPAPQVAPAAKPATPAAPTAAVPAPRPVSPPPMTAKAPAQAPVQAAPVVAEPAPAAVPTPTKSGGDPGGPVAVAATKPGLKRVGAEACGDCHDVQFESWSTSKHAARNPPLDCEDCHGPGSEYKANSVMKDPAKARAAGLVIPDRAFCSKCHTSGVNDAFLAKAHAHE